MKVYILTYENYLDTITQTYRKIVVINKKPMGSLINLVKQLKYNKLSIFDNNTRNCLYAIKHPYTNELLDIEDISDLFEFLISNGYIIDKNISKLYFKNNTLDNKFICVITLT
jgi:hypothetical protein